MTGKITAEEIARRGLNDPVHDTSIESELGEVAGQTNASSTQDFGVPSIADPIDETAHATGSSPPLPKTQVIDAAIQELTLPDFIDTVFGQMLQVPYFTDPV